MSLAQNFTILVIKTLALHLHYYSSITIIVIIISFQIPSYQVLITAIYSVTFAVIFETLYFITTIL